MDRFQLLMLEQALIYLEALVATDARYLDYLLPLQKLHYAECAEWEYEEMLKKAKNLLIEHRYQI